MFGTMFGTEVRDRIRDALWYIRATGKRTGNNYRQTSTMLPWTPLTEEQIFDYVRENGDIPMLATRRPLTPPEEEAIKYAVQNKYFLGLARGRDDNLTDAEHAFFGNVVWCGVCMCWSKYEEDLIKYFDENGDLLTLTILFDPELANAWELLLSVILHHGLGEVDKGFTIEDQEELFGEVVPNPFA
jgi:hypothetical protein